VNVESSFFVTVDYGASINTMIMVGNYNYVHPFIRAMMSLSDNWERESRILIELVRFGRPIQSPKIAEEFYQHGFRPATLKALLSLGSSYPCQQEVAQIVGLGSIWRDALGLKIVPVLSSYHNKRLLDLTCLADIWASHYRFAVVRKLLGDI